MLSPLTQGRELKFPEDYWTYTTASAGSAGTAYVNDYTGNLVFVHGDVATTGLLAPVTLEHVYNGYMAGIKYTKNYVTVGRGWKMSVQQTVRSSKEYGLSGSALNATPYAYEDGDGTVHFFYKKTENGKTKYLDEDGLGLELKIISGINCTITDEKDNVLTFDARGNLSTIKDANGNAITISYQKDGDIYRITKITDGAGHVITVTQNDSTNHYLASLKDPAGRVTTYSYAVNDTWGTGCLTKITYPDGTKSQFEYDSDRALKKVIANDGTSLEFTYTSKAKGKRVSKIVEKGANGKTGQTILFDRSNYNNTIIRTSGIDNTINTSDDIIQTYQFDNFGRTVCIKNQKASGTDLGTSMYQYTSGSKNSSASNIKQLNRVTHQASADNSTRNYLKNHSGESSGNWVSSYWINSEADYTTSRTTGQQLFGNYSLRVKVNQTQSNGGGCYYQQVDGSNLTAGGAYTLSAYVKTNGLTRANSAAQGQLTRENNRYLNATIVYAYDGGGNLTSRTIYPYTTGELGEATDTITYTYDSQWKDLLTGYDGQSITSDEIGNPLTYRDGMSMSWDGRQLTQLTKDGTTITYQYGSDGLRTSKTVNGEEYRYWYQDGQLVYEERGDSKQFYYSYDGYGHLSCIRYYHNGTGYVYYVQTNSRGDVEALYLGDGSLRVRYLYDSWGNTISIQNGNGQELTGPNDIANLNPFRYRGYYLDSETGLYYLHNRYYDPQTCRFLNADTTDILAAKGDLYDKNLFAYCDNNPVARVDYGGEFWVQVGATFGGFLLSGSLEERKQFQTYASEPVRMMKYADREDISGQSRKEYEAIEAIYRQMQKKRKHANNTELPESYDEISISGYRQRICEYVYTRYPEVA